ncbi:MAG: DUF86 domain-containing protein [Planctomycetota bacterium]|jgi:uncharacterized protein YutE (UPF0331/DUF86 family)|nr:DUF86 domain-containing protein [Planctomycetota bacterium]
MVDKSIIMERIEEIQKNVKILDELSQISREEFLGNARHYLLVERCLQLSIECLTDICYHIAGKSGWGKPLNSAEAILLMGGKGILEADFARSIVGMANFRNILVHAYLNINRSIVYDHLQQVSDFREFERQIIEYLGGIKSD